MAKKKPAKKPAKKAARSAKRPAPAAKKAAAKRRAAHKLPANQSLPGMEQVRIVALERCCRSIAECRATKNAATAEEKGLTQQALRELVKHDRGSYRAHGVELLYVPGDAKVRVRLVDSDEAAEDGDGGPTEDAKTADLDELNGATAGDGDGADRGDE